MQSSISGTVSDSLSGKTIVVGVTGSIAAVRVVDLVRDLIRRGAAVHCVMSGAATQIIHPYALEYASGNLAITVITGRVEHVEFCGVGGKADLFLVAPATANTIGKMAQGIDDTPVTTFATTAIGSGKPVMVVPAMHEAMYRHPAVLKNLEALRSMGVCIVAPRIEEEKAKIADSPGIVIEVERTLGPRDLTSKRILITSGSNAERVDPIRILTNRASGRTGVEIALECYRRGADVTIVHRSRLGLPIKEVYAESAQEMLDAVLSELKPKPRSNLDLNLNPNLDSNSNSNSNSNSDAGLDSSYDALISAAAIADYTVDSSPEKIKSGQELVLRLKPTRKMIKEVRRAYPNLKIVGFKAETNVTEDELIRRAVESLRSSDLNLVVANDVGSGGMGTEENRVTILDKEGKTRQVKGKKSLIAKEVVKALLGVL